MESSDPVTVSRSSVPGCSSTRPSLHVTSSSPGIAWRECGLGNAQESWVTWLLNMDQLCTL